MKFGILRSLTGINENQGNETINVTRMRLGGDCIAFNCGGRTRKRIDHNCLNRNYIVSHVTNVTDAGVEELVAPWEFSSPW